MPVRACIFDVFGTLTDWRTGIARAAARPLADTGLAPERLADLWRAEYQPGMARVRAGARPYVGLELLHSENLDRVLATEGVDLPQKARVELNAAWSALPAWPDVSGALAHLRLTHRIAPCSNGSIPMMIGIARANDLRWDCIAGAALARDYKPSHPVYLAAAEALGHAPGEVMMVAAHNDDLAAARAAGLATGFFPRPTEYGAGQTTDLAPAQDWDICAPDLPALVARLTGG